MTDQALNADLRYETLKDDAQILPNGDLRVKQRIRIFLNSDKTWHQLYQRYKLNATETGENPLSAITDVTVTDVDAGSQYVRGTSGRHDDPDWDDRYAGQWYAEDVTASQKGVKHTAYLHAAMNDIQYCNAIGHKNCTQKEGQDGANQPEGEANQSADGSADSKDGAQSGGGPAPDPQADESLAKSPSTMGGSRDEIEIGWNIPTKEHSEYRRFDISMTFKDVVKVYDDVAYLKWEPLGDSNGTPVSAFSFIVKMPDGVTKHDANHWLHFGGDGRWWYGDDGSVDGIVSSITPRKHVDLVSMFPASAMAGDVRHRIKGNYRRQVLERERREVELADAVKTWGAAERRNLYLLFFIPEFAVILLGAGLVVYGNRKAGYCGSVDYYRDIPNMTATVAAQFLDELEASADPKLSSRQLAAALLSLASKHVIAIYPGESQWYAGVDWRDFTNAEIADRMRRGADGEFNGSPDGYAGHMPGGKYSKTRGGGEPLADRLRRQKVGLVDSVKQATGFGKRRSTNTIVILPDGHDLTSSAASKLSGSEKKLLQLLQAISNRLHLDAFDFEDIHDNLTQWSEGASKESAFEIKVAAEYHRLHLTRSSSTIPVFQFAYGLLALAGVLGAVYLYLLFLGPLKIGTRLFGTQALYLHAQPGLLFKLALPVAFFLILEAMLLQTVVLTKKGNELAGQVLGLRRYLRDFGNFEDRAPADLALWDQYLIYATAFGISDQWAQDATSLQPQLSDGDWLDANASGSLFYWQLYPSSHGFDGVNGGGFDFGDFSDFGSTLSESMSFSTDSGGGDFGGSSDGGGSFGGSGGGSFGGW